jgi:hypothetical protein
MLFLDKEMYNKLQQKKYGPYNIIKKIYDNVYIVNMPDNSGGFVRFLML